GDVEVVEAMNTAVAIDDALLRVVAHAAGAHVMMAAMEFIWPRMVVREYPIIELEATDSQTSELCPDKLLRMPEAALVELREPPVQRNAIEPEGISLADQLHAAFRIGTLLQARIEADGPRKVIRRMIGVARRSAKNAARYVIQTGHHVPDIAPDVVWQPAVGE